MPPLILPTFIELPRKRTKPKKVYITFNSMKTQHFQVYNACKHAYLEIVRLQTPTPIPTPCRVICTYFPTGSRTCDVDNAFPVVKFVNDAMVTLGCLHGDDSKYIHEVLYRFGTPTRTNPRYEVEYVPM